MDQGFRVRRCSFDCGAGGGLGFRRVVEGLASAKDLVEGPVEDLPGETCAPDVLEDVERQQPVAAVVDELGKGHVGFGLQPAHGQLGTQALELGVGRSRLGAEGQAEYAREKQCRAGGREKTVAAGGA